MKKTSALVGFGLWACITGQAFAQSVEIPRIDVDGLCQALSSKGEYYKNEPKVCIAHLQRAYDNIKAHWSSISDAAKIQCIDQMRSNSYVVLDECVMAMWAGEKYKREHPPERQDTFKY